MPTKFGAFLTGKLFSRMFLALFLFFIGFSAYETGSALRLLTGRNWFGAVYAVFALAAAAMLTKKTVSEKWNCRRYRQAVSFLSCFFLYYLLVQTAWELLCCIFPVTAKAKTVGVLVSAVPAVLTVLFGYRHTKSIRVKRYDITLGSGEKTYDIALISDIHLGIFVGEKHIAEAVRKINALSVDLVVISGDIFDVDRSLLNDSAAMQRISKQFRKLRAREGVYAVVGNHDPKISDGDFVRFLKASRIRLLDDAWTELSEILLLGRTDKGNNPRKEYSDIPFPPDIRKPVVVLDHNPQETDDAIAHGASLVLCGHTHRGQLFPITLFTRWANGKKRFYGHHDYGQAHGVITSGVGFFELPVRIGTDNEIVRIHLQI